jgi:hypothetical protein
MATLQSPIAVQNLPTALSINNVTTGPGSSINWIISALTIANTSTTVAINVSVGITSSGTTYYLARLANLPIGETLTIGGNGAKLILGNGWGISAYADTASSADCTVHYASVP